MNHPSGSFSIELITAVDKPITNNKNETENLRCIFKFATSIHILYIRGHFSFPLPMALINACI